MWIIILLLLICFNSAVCGCGVAHLASLNKMIDLTLAVKSNIHNVLDCQPAAHTLDQYFMPQFRKWAFESSFVVLLSTTSFVLNMILLFGSSTFPNIFLNITAGVNAAVVVLALLLLHRHKAIIIKYKELYTTFKSIEIIKQLKQES